MYTIALVLSSVLQWRMKERNSVKAVETANTGSNLTPDNILTPDQLAALLKVSRKWVFEKTRKRCPQPIPCLRIGRFLRFRLRDIEAWLETTKEQKAA